MMTQGVIRIGTILACVTPSMVCFGLAAYLLANGINQGWGWLILVGFLALEVPKKLVRVPEECLQCKARARSQKPASPYYQEIA